MVTIPVARPTATVTIEPTGRRSAGHRTHDVKVLLRLSVSQAKYADKSHTAEVARQALVGISPGPGGDSDNRKVSEVSVTSKGVKGGGMVSTVMAIEGVASCSERPSEDAIDAVRDALVAEGYRVTVRERRDCAEPDCKNDAVVDWNHKMEQPPGWHTTLVCGGHNYRTCSKCKSLYVLTNTNSVGPAPSVHCEVCGLIMIEWGSSKVWQATLVGKAG